MYRAKRSGGGRIALRDGSGLCEVVRGASLRHRSSRPGPRDLGADFHLCGPTDFTDELQEGLQARGVHRDRIQSETFGPAGGRAA